VPATLTKQGVAGLFALVFGVAYIAVAIVEQVRGAKGVLLNTPPEDINDILLLKSTNHNIIHFATGGILLLALFAGMAKPAVRLIGVIFLVVTIVGLVAPDFTMDDLLNYPDGAGQVPIAYTIIHGITALGALFAGFVASD
jgi:hypothetical protein